MKRARDSDISLNYIVNGSVSCEHKKLIFDSKTHIAKKCIHGKYSCEECDTECKCKYNCEKCGIEFTCNYHSIFCEHEKERECCEECSAKYCEHGQYPYDCKECDTEYHFRYACKVPMEYGPGGRLRALYSNSRLQAKEYDTMSLLKPSSNRNNKQ